MYLRVSQSHGASYSTATVALILLIFLVSCSSSFKGGPDRVITQTNVKSYFAAGFSPGQYSKYRAGSGTERLRLRNSIVLSTMGAMDIEYTRFEQQLTSERQGVPLLTTTTSLALSATSTVVGNATTKAGLAAADTFLKGTKEAYDKEVLANQTIGALQTQMRANRSAVRSRIISLLAQSDDAYPLELALADMEDYYSAGTITSGLIGINAQASESLAATEAHRVDTVSRFGPNDATATIRQYLTQGGKAEVGRLQAWMRARNIDVSIAIFLNAAEYSKYRDAYASTL